MNRLSMKKHLYSIALVCAVAAIACNKTEDTLPETNEGKVESLTAIIEEDVSTRTDYTSAGVFSWSEGDAFARLGRSSTYNTSIYSAESGIGGKASGTFTGTAQTGACTYAIYPVSASNGANITVDKTSGSLYLTRPSTITYNHSNPLKDLVPMLGKLSGDVFTFYPLSSVIGFHATGIPSTVTSITLTTKSGTKGLSGKSVLLTSNSNPDAGISGLDMESVGWKREWMASNDTGVTLEFVANSFSEADFYFPVPSSATYEGLTITLKSGETVSKTISTSNSIAVGRGKIIILPSISCSLVPPSATVSGDLNNRVANFTMHDAAKIKYALTTSSTATLSSLSSTVTTETSASLTPPTTGTYYLVYQGYLPDGTTEVGGEYRIKFLYASNSVSDLAGKYLINNNPNWGFEVAAINPADGEGNNIKITTYYSNNGSYNLASGECKGVFDPASGTVTIPSCQTLTKNTTTYYLVGIDIFDSATSNYKYTDNLSFTLTAVDDNAAIKLLGTHSTKAGVCIATTINTETNSFTSGGQHFTSDGVSGPLFLYKAN